MFQASSLSPIESPQEANLIRAAILKWQYNTDQVNTELRVNLALILNKHYSVGLPLCKCRIIMKNINKLLIEWISGRHITLIVFLGCSYLFVAL